MHCTLQTLQMIQILPTLIEFVRFDLNTMEITLLFDEPLDVSTFNVSGVRLQSLFEDPVANYTPKTASNVAVMGRYLTFTLSDYDHVQIKERRYLCSIRGNCYVWINSDLISDVYGNVLSNTSNQEPGRLVTELIPDDQPAVLENFILDLNANSLILTFNEPVKPIFS